MQEINGKYYFLTKFGEAMARFTLEDKLGIYKEYHIQSITMNRSIINGTIVDLCSQSNLPEPITRVGIKISRFESLLLEKPKSLIKLKTIEPFAVYNDNTNVLDLSVIAKLLEVLDRVQEIQYA